MIKVMIVDDEMIVRLGIQALANWEDFGFSLCYEASNGLQALEVLRENPDIQIVFVDIQMPKMDGLQFLEEINKLGLTIKVVVLSAHDQYDFIRRAFKLGVSDYIMKTEMNKDEILKQLQNAAAQLEKSKDENQGVEAVDKIRIKEKFLADILVNMNIEPHENNMKILEIDQSFTYFSAGCVLVENYSEIKDRLPIVRNITKDIMKNVFFIEMAVIAPGELGMLFAFKNKSMGTSDGELNTVLRKLKNRLQNYMNFNATIGVSSVASGIEQIDKQYKIARQNADMKFILGRGKIIFPSDVKSIVSHDIGSIAVQNRKLIDAMRDGNSVNIISELEQIFETINQYNPRNVRKIFPYYMEVIYSIIQYVNSNGSVTNEIFGRDVNFYEEIHKFETREELNNWLRNIVQWVSKFLIEKKNGELHRHIVMAQKFIRKNYDDKTLSLKMVSDYVGLSENYLSSIFAKQTGKSFTEYVTEIRIKKAEILLLETNLKIYEIAEKVGFANTEYFSKTFKKLSGKSPNHFLKRAENIK